MALGVSVVLYIGVDFGFIQQPTQSLTLSVVVLQLGPWLAVEIPDLISKGLVVHKERTTESAKSS
jgi:hypothetical protein